MAGEQVRRGFCNDRISTLPCDVIDRILMLLPLRDAVRTSILSTEWRHNWLSIPHLVFDSGDCNHHSSVVYQVLRRHKGPIVKFWFTNVNFYNHRAIDYWLQFLLNYHSRIEDIKLELDPNYGYVITQSLFSFEHLRHLHLQGVEINFPSTFKGFNSLVTLTLNSPWGTTYMLKTFTSKCPNLKIINVHYFDDAILNCLDIVAPNLEMFHHFGLFSPIYLKCPSIKEVSLDYCDFHIEPRHLLDGFEVPNSLGCKSSLVKFFCQIPLIERMRFQGNNLMQFLAIGGVPQTLPDKLNHLTQLDIDNINLGREECVRIVVCLIRSSPKLKCLQIKSHTSEAEPGTIQYLKEQQEHKVQLCCLENVKIDHMSNEKACVEIVKLLFMWAHVLEKLEIKCLNSTEKPLEVLKKLSSFRRASSNAELLFYEA